MPKDLEGTRGEVTWKIADEHCTRRGEYDIFSTPAMVRLLEIAAVEALKPCLAVDQASVGTRVDVKHLAPTLKGMDVHAVATVRQVDGQRVIFDVEIVDDVQKVGEAVHERFIVDLDRYAQRLKQKHAAALANG